MNVDQFRKLPPRQYLHTWILALVRDNCSLIPSWVTSGMAVGLFRKPLSWHYLLTCTLALVRDTCLFITSGVTSDMAVDFSLESLLRCDIASLMNYLHTSLWSPISSTFTMWPFTSFSYRLIGLIFNSAMCLSFPRQKVIVAYIAMLCSLLHCARQP